MDNTNQNAFQDNQNFSIDIDKIYSDFIKQIDSVRSNVSIVNKANQNILNTLKESDVSKLSKLLKVESSPQESRFHAFMRIIGFPVISENGEKRFYNPGLDIIPVKNKSIKLETKIKISNNPIKGFREISVERENYFNNISSIFANNTNINASVLALSSINTRKFISSLDPSKSTDPFDVSLKNQAYQISLSSIVGNDNTIKLNEYIDANGNKPTVFNSLKNRYHIIKPIIVDSRIDFSVNPSMNKIAVPFVNDKSYLKIDEINYVNKPLIEKIIIERFSTSDSTSLGTFKTSVKDMILNTDIVKNENLIKQMSSDIYQISDSSQFVKYLNIIKTMIKILVESQNTIQDTQSKYYWLPIPSKSGTEFLSENRSPILFKNIPGVDVSAFITQKDKDVLNSYLRYLSSQFNYQVKDTQIDVGNYNSNTFNISFNTDTTESIEDNNKTVYENLILKRSNDLESASKALRNIEIIMGEFSGLGLCDIIAVMASLYTMPKENLLGFLDDDAFSRFVSVSKIQPDRSSIDDSINVLLKMMINFYNIMDKIFIDIKENNNFY